MAQVERSQAARGQEDEVLDDAPVGFGARVIRKHI
jgi:hypothetical protein